MTASRRCSPRSTRETVRRHEDQQRELISALLDSIEPVQRDLAGRLNRCQQAREARRGWRDMRDVVSGDYPHRCRLLACWACRRPIVRRWEDDARSRFASAANRACTMVSIVLSSTNKIDAAGSIVGKARKDFANMRAAAYQQPGGWRWHSVQAFGIVKLDVVALDGAALSTPGRSTLVPSFPMITPAGNTLWLTRVNLAVHHPHLDRAELARAGMRRWPGSGRVSLRPFEDGRTAADNVATVVGSMLEGFERIGLNDTDSRREARWHAQFQSWLFGLRRGLQPLFMSSRARPMHDVSHADDGCFTAGDDWKSEEIEPMPVLV